MGRGRGKKKTFNASLNITSMMDMFTIILLFLLKSYSSDGAILTNTDGLVLPNSMSKKKPKEVNLQLGVTSEMVLLDNQAICPTEDVRKIPQEDPDPFVPEIKEKLDTYYAQEEEMVKMGALMKVNGAIIVQLDKNMEFDVMFKIMNTCGKAGYNNMNFAVMERDG